MERKFHSLKCLWDNIKQCHICLSGFLREEGRIGNVFEETVNENF